MLKRVPIPKIWWVLSEGCGHLITGPFTGWVTEFEVGEGCHHFAAFSGVEVRVNGVITGEGIPKGSGLLRGSIIWIWGVPNGSGRLVLLSHGLGCWWVRWIRSWWWRRCHLQLAEGPCGGLIYDGS